MIAPARGPVAESVDGGRLERRSGRKQPPDSVLLRNNAGAAPEPGPGPARSGVPEEKGRPPRPRRPQAAAWISRNDRS
jgi:hypothetical protein